VAETSLYRRHRPQTFDEVVGQEHVVRTLRNAVERDRVHHAYLFVGSRGTGKTSVAKILARSLNCEHGPTTKPCGKCDSCRAIAGGTSLDVIEMDAASNRSVDDIRELRERVGFVPATGRSKVYILDEAHMLTREAWNAFLKTLEEPPPSTVFVLATTEPHKVMPTIVDRCQRFDFGRPSAEQIAGVVRRVATIEEILISNDAVAAVARAASGSFRDALGTLDQLVAYSGGEIATDDALAVLGVADADLIFGTVEAIAAHDGRAAILAVDELSRSGRDAVRFARDVISHLRQLLVVRSIGEVPESFALVAAHSERLAEQAERLGEVALVRAIDALSAALSGIREGDDARMALELALLRSARPEIDPSREALAQRLERIEQSLGGVQTSGSASAGEVTAKREQTVTRTASPDSSADAEDGISGAITTGSADVAAGQAKGAAGRAVDKARAPESQAAHEADGTEGAAGDETDEPGGAQSGPGPSTTREPAEIRDAEQRHEPSVATALVEPEDPGSPPATQPTALETPAGRGSTKEVNGRASAPDPRKSKPTGPAVDLDLENVISVWPAVLAQLRDSGSDLLATVVEAAKPVSLDPNRSLVEIGFAATSAFNKRKAEMKGNRELLSEALKTVTGAELRAVFILLEPVDGAGVDETGDGELSGEQEEALIERLKSEFDAEELEPDAKPATPEAGHGKPERDSEAGSERPERDTDVGHGKPERDSEAERDKPEREEPR